MDFPTEPIYSIDDMNQIVNGMLNKLAYSRLELHSAWQIIAFLMKQPVSKKAGNEIVITQAELNEVVDKYYVESKVNRTNDINTDSITIRLVSNASDKSNGDKPAIDVQNVVEEAMRIIQDAKDGGNNDK